MLTDLQRIVHMIETADSILQFVSNITETGFSASLEKQYAVKFAFVMLGEDAALISDMLKSQYPDVPWRDIKGMRNTVAHDYCKTDDNIVWETITRDIAPLRQRLMQIKIELEL